MVLGIAVLAAGMAGGAGCRSARAPSRQDVFRPLLTQPVAAPAAEPAGPLTLEAAIARAMDYNPAVVDARSAADAALMGLRAAGTIRDPEIRGGLGRGTGEGDQVSGGRKVDRLTLPRDYYTTVYPLPLFEDKNEDGIADTPIVQHLETEGPTVSTNGSTSHSTQEEKFNSIAVRIFPPNPWVYAASVSGARAALHAAEASWFQVRNEAEIEIRRLFAEGAHAEKDGRLLERLLESRRRLLDVVRDGLAAGRFTKPDELQFHRQYLDTLSALDQSRRTLARVKGLIAARTGYVKPPEIVFDAGDPAVPADWTPEALWAHALENRGDLAALHWKSIALHAVWREAMAERIPWFSFIQGAYSESEQDAEETGGGFSRSSTRHMIQDGDMLLQPGYRYNYIERHSALETDHSTAHRDAEEWRVDAGVVLPIFSWLSRAPEARRAEYRRAVLAAETARNQVRDDVAAALDEARHLGRVKEEFAKASEPVIREMKATLAEVEQSNALAPDQRFKAEQQVLESERLMSGYEYEYELSLIALREKAGGLPAALPAKAAAPAAAP